MARYLGEVLCPRLGLPSSGLQIFVPRHGLKTQMLIVRGEGIEPCVVRFHRNPVDARICLRAHKLAEKKELPVPRIVYHDLSLPHRLRHGFAVQVEQYVRGAHLDPGTLGAERLDALASTLARLHSITPSMRRTPLFPNGRDFYRTVIRVKIQNRIESLTALPEEFTAQDQERLAAFSNRMMQQWSNLPSLTLTHDKINRGNIVFAGDGHAYLIDLITLRYGVPGKDLVAALYYFCGNEEEEKRLTDAYFSRLDPVHREHFEQFEPLYRVWHHLGRWSSKSRAFAKKAVKNGAIKPSSAYPSRFAERDAVWNWVGKTES